MTFTTFHSDHFYSAEHPSAPLELKRKTAKPSSAPAAAGRSPKSNRIGVLSRRRVSASPFTRIDPPMFAGGRSQDAVPFSIDAALSGTVSSYKVKPQLPVEAFILEDSNPKGWMLGFESQLHLCSGKWGRFSIIGLT